MKITDVRIKKLEGDNKLKAIASITFDEEFVVHDIKVIQGQSGLFVAMPSRKASDGTFKDTAHPIVTSLREEISRIVLSKYEENE